MVSSANSQPPLRRRTLSQCAQQVGSIPALGQRLRQLLQFGAVDETLAPGDFFRAGDLQALAALQRGEELAGIEQSVVRAGVQPGIAALPDLHIELAVLQVGVVDAGDFQLAARAGLDGLGDVDDLAVVEIQASDGVAALGLGRLLLDADGLA